MAKKKTVQYPVKFFKGTLQQYNSITPSDFTFYFLTDVDKIYLGDVELSNVDITNRINAINDFLNGVAQIQMKTKAEWTSDPSTVSSLNTFYIYTDRYTKTDDHGNVTNIPGIKVGDGVSYIVDLPFVDQIFEDHINNSNIHVTLAEKTFWNNKVRIEETEIDEQNLIFTIY